MANSIPVRLMTVPWRKVCAALPAVALLGAGIAFAAPAAPALDINAVAVSNNTAIVVPDTAMTPAVPAPIWTDPFGPKVPVFGPPLPGTSAPALALPEGTVPGSSAVVALDSTGIPVRALDAYRRAASLVGAADPACHIDWALLAAIGRVESNHGRFGGNQLDSEGVAQPGIIGIPLDGTNGTARITDTDGGRLDRDSVYDRAVGPMQFIPGTWNAAGADADGDGVKNPQDMADAAAAAAVYLCSGPGDLHLPGDLRAAIMRYNPSDSYVRTVTAIAHAYRQGVTALPASDLPAASPAPSTPMVVNTVPSPPRQTPPARTSAAPPPARPSPRPVAPGPSAPGPGPVAPGPVAPGPVQPGPVVPGPVEPGPVVPGPVEPGPVVPGPVEPGPVEPGPVDPVPTLPDPCLPIPTTTDPPPTDPVPPIPCLTSTPPAQEICVNTPLGTCTVVPFLLDPAPAPAP
jgi:hypothetical protein